jgi:pimeloyl-ACP methyl ester carboxylesterase
MCNFDYFDIRTPAGKSYDLQLPSPLATWARRDPYIRRDPMRYYNLPHYLWLKGYDVWLANYRGQGREPYMSGGAGAYTASDCGIYDLPAIIEKVYEVTNKHPVWLGHSMGASFAYIYLEGAKYADGDESHIVFDPSLAAERNGGNGPQSLKGFVDLDGPLEAVAVVPDAGNLSDLGYIDLRFFTANFGEALSGIFYFTTQVIWFLYQIYGCPDLGMLNAILTINPNNLDPHVNAYISTYAADGVSAGIFAGIVDQVQGDASDGSSEAPSADAGNLYGDNLDKITLPALVVADGTLDLTNPEGIRDVYLRKTRNRADVFMEIPGTAHMDLVFGLNAPSTLYPEIHNWLKKLRKPRWGRG